MNYKNINNLHSREAVINIMKRNNFVDAFRFFHPALKRSTVFTRIKAAALIFSNQKCGGFNSRVALIRWRL